MSRGQPLPRGDEKARVVRGMFDAIAGRYDVVNRIMTFGLDIGWRRRAVRALRLPPRSLVFDVACGTGDFCKELAAAGHRPVGFDFAWQMLRAARTQAPLVQADALRLPVADRSADGLTCGFALRNVADLAKLFEEMARVVRPGGRIALLETSTPERPLLRKGHRFYTTQVIPRIGGLLSDREAYTYLPRSSEYLPEPEALLAMLREPGFDAVERVTLLGGSAQLILGTRR